MRGMILALLAVAIVFGVAYDGSMYFLYDHIVDSINIATQYVR
jgi:hypothetical protein